MERRQGQGMIEVMEGRQVQRLSPQQIMLAGLIEKPITALEEEIKNKIDENFTLEAKSTDEPIGNFESNDGEGDEYGNEDFGDNIYKSTAEERRQIEEDSGEGELKVYAPKMHGGIPNESIIGDTKSFIDDLESQISEYNLNEHQTFLIRYLIGCLDSRGFIDQPITRIVDDLLFDENVETDEKEIEEVLSVLQQFEPLGIGARSEQECLLIQLDHNISLTTNPSVLADLKLARNIISQRYDLFLHNNTAQMADAMGVAISDIEQAFEQIRHLNPRPGTSLSESAADREVTVVSDVVIETDEESINFYLNDENIPSMQVREEYVTLLKQAEKAKGRMSARDREGLEYTKKMVGEANSFISAVAERQKTILKVVQALVHLQRDFILSQDDADLHPITLNDVSRLVHLDTSTVSRVKSNKYVVLDGSVYPMDKFFLRVHKNADGEELQHQQIKQRIGELIQNEDKAAPYSDQQIVDILNKEGHMISRRTINKYREEMGIPIAKKRKSII